MPTYVDQWSDTWSDIWGQAVLNPGDLPAGTLPVVNLTTQQILYGSRTTSYRFELLTHQSDGHDALTGILDGVLPGSSLSWAGNQLVRGTGTLLVADLAVAQPGLTPISALNLTTIRIRPVLVIQGLPDIPLGTFCIAKAPETWSDETRVYNLQLLDRTTMLDQDQVSAAFTAVTTSSVMSQIASLIATSNERFDPDSNNTQTLAMAMVWPIGTSKLQIVNDLLAAINYMPLTVAGNGALQTSPYVSPEARTITYGLLNGIPRQLVDGAASIYEPDWNRDRDVFGVPNKVVTVAAASGAAAPLAGVYTNTDPTSPFSYAARGNRWIVQTIQSVQIPQDTTANQQTFLNNIARDVLIAQSSPAATVTVKHLPLPLQIDDVVEFASTPAGIDARHVVVGLQLDLVPTGLMQSSLQQVVDL